MILQYIHPLSVGPVTGERNCEACDSAVCVGFVHVRTRKRTCLASLRRELEAQPQAAADEIPGSSGLANTPLKWVPNSFHASTGLWKRQRSGPKSTCVTVTQVVSFVMWNTELTRPAPWQEALLSSADTKWKVDTSKLRFDERPPATQSLILQKVCLECVYCRWSRRVTFATKPARITESGCSATSWISYVPPKSRPATSFSWLIVSKSCLEQDKGQAGVIRKKQYALTMRGTLAAPKPEAPPKWNLSCCTLASYLAVIIALHARAIVARARVKSDSDRPQAKDCSKGQTRHREYDTSLRYTTTLVACTMQTMCDSRSFARRRQQRSSSLSCKQSRRCRLNTPTAAGKLEAVLVGIRGVKQRHALSNRLVPIAEIFSGSNAPSRPCNSGPWWPAAHGWFARQQARARLLPWPSVAFN
eukprot:2068656-Rhodomonas_salina.1